MKGFALIALLPALAVAEHVRGVDPACELLPCMSFLLEFSALATELVPYSHLISFPKSVWDSY